MEIQDTCLLAIAYNVVYVEDLRYQSTDSVIYTDTVFLNMVPEALGLFKSKYTPCTQLLSFSWIFFKEFS